MRTIAREIAFKKIYQSLFMDIDIDNFDGFDEYNKLNNKEDKDFISSLLNLYKDNKQEIDNTISNLLVDYTLDRVYRIDRAIISLAIVEIKYYKKNPVAVVINEAVELAKKYGTEKSYSFVNGLLKKVAED